MQIVSSGDMYNISSMCSAKDVSSCLQNDEISSYNCTTFPNGNQSFLLTTEACLGDNSAPNTSDGGLFFTWFNVTGEEAACNSTSPPLWTYSFGKNYSCVPFLVALSGDASWGQIVEINGTYSASLFCSSSTCNSCLIEAVDVTLGECNTISVQNTSLYQNTWTINSRSQFSQCAQASSSSGLSDSQVWGVVAGGAVAYMIIVALGTLWVKKNAKKFKYIPLQ
jgi:hypothetical protein